MEFSFYLHLNEIPCSKSELLEKIRTNSLNSADEFFFIDKSGDRIEFDENSLENIKETFTDGKIKFICRKRNVLSESIIHSTINKESNNIEDSYVLAESMIFSLNENNDKEKIDNSLNLAEIYLKNLDEKFNFDT